jgi:predicted  nucleic acid-binding Zn-ribbon protein
MAPERPAPKRAGGRPGAEETDERLRAAAHEEAVLRRRAGLLESELALLERRLAEVEESRAVSAGLLAAQERELEASRAHSRLLVTRLTAPLRALERALRWLLEKAARAAGLLARQVAFRRRRRRG